MSEVNDGLSRPVGQCCAGKHCVDNSLELSQQHKCTTCNKVVHMVCGEPGSDDELTCFSCARGVATLTDDLQDHEDAPAAGQEGADLEALTESTEEPVGKKKSVSRTSSTIGRKTRSRGPRIKVGCRVKTTPSKLFHVLSTPSQRECLPASAANSRNYYGTVTKGNTSNGYYVRFDALPQGENEVKLIRQKLRVVADGEEEKPYDREVSQASTIEGKKGGNPSRMQKTTQEFCDMGKDDIANTRSFEI